VGTIARLSWSQESILGKMVRRVFHPADDRQAPSQSTV
jgi:hypothetical protein